MSIQYKTVPIPEGWSPAKTCDLATVSQTAFRAVITGFKDWVATHPPVFQFETGWYKFNAYLAEEVLKRTTEGQRYVDLKTVKRYYRDMKRGKWGATGEPGIQDDNGRFIDIQHRATACYYGGDVEFPVFILCDVPARPELSTQIDMGLPRNAAAALTMSGYVPGYEAPVAAAIKVAHKYEHRAWKIGNRNKVALDELTNPEVVDWFVDHDDIGQAAEIVLVNFPAAVKLIKNKGVAVFVAWKIINLYGPQMLDNFMIGVGTGADMEDDDPRAALRHRFQIGAHDTDLDAARRLGLTIKAFNMFRLGQTVRLGRGRNTGLYIGDNEAFPRFEERVHAFDDNAERDEAAE